MWSDGHTSAHGIFVEVSLLRHKLTDKTLHMFKVYSLIDCGIVYTQAFGVHGNFFQDACRYENLKIHESLVQYRQYLHMAYTQPPIYFKSILEYL